jgi:branched-chain amino acid transport system substrate-binding protein
MKKLWIILGIVVVVALAIVLVVTQTKKEPEVLKIGIMTPLTGDVSSWGAMQRRATELALEVIKDLRVKVIYEDDQANPKVGVNAFRKLVDVDKVTIVVGSPASNVTLAVSPLANERKVVLLSSGSTATEVGKAGPYIFRIMPSDEVQSSIMADWAWQLGYKRVAVIYVENAWGRGLMEAFTKDFKAKDGIILTIQATDQDATDFRTQLSKIQGLKPDVIYAPLYTRGAGLMIKQAREMGLKQQVLGADVYGTPELIQSGGDAVNGVLYTTFGEYHGSEHQEFAKRYKEKYGLDVETYATYCYDAFMIAVEAIKRIPKGKAINGPNIREELLRIKDYHGVTGLTTFDGRNNAIGKTFDKMTMNHSPG